MLDAAHGVDAQNGAEQPQWEPLTGRFYLSIPQIGPAVSNGGLCASLQRHHGGSESTRCNFADRPALPRPTPRSLHRLQHGVRYGRQRVEPGRERHRRAPGRYYRCEDRQERPGALDANVLGVGAGDEVWYNSGDNNYYATGSGSPFRPLPAATAQGSTPLGVVDAKDQTVLQLLTTFNVPAVTTGSSQHPAGTSHSVAANAANNHVLVPIPANNAFPDCLTGCIAVFAHPDEDRPGEGVSP